MARDYPKALLDYLLSNGYERLDDDSPAIYMKPDVAAVIRFRHHLDPAQAWAVYYGGADGTREDVWVATADEVLAFLKTLEG